MTNLEYALILTEEINGILKGLEPIVMAAIDIESPKDADEAQNRNLRLGALMAFETVYLTLTNMKDVAAKNVIRYVHSVNKIPEA